MNNDECKGAYWSEINENVWKCSCGIRGPWACQKFVADNERANAAAQVAYDATVAERMEEGRTLYRTGHPATACRAVKMDARRTEKVEPAENIDRLVGYIEEMRRSRGPAA